jgi:hypothetical protein
MTLTRRPHIVAKSKQVVDVDDFELITWLVIKSK